MTKIFLLSRRVGKLFCHKKLMNYDGIINNSLINVHGYLNKNMFNKTEINQIKMLFSLIINSYENGNNFIIDMLDCKLRIVKNKK